MGMAGEDNEKGLFYGSKSSSFRPESEIKGPPRDNFLDIQNALKFGGLDDDARRELQRQREEMVNKAAEASLFDDASISLTSIIKRSNWDNVYGNMLGQIDNLERSARRFYSSNSEWKGMVETVVRGAAAKVALGGIQEKGIGATPEWLREHGYIGLDAIQSLRERVDQDYIYPVVGDAPELLVGDNLEKPIVQPGPQPADIIRQQQQLIDQLIQQALQNQITPAALREAIGQMNPEMLRQLYRKAERAMVQLPDAEVQLPTFLLAEDVPESLILEWQARVRLANACAYQRAAPSFKDLFPNKPAQEITNAQTEALLNKEGVLEAKSLVTIILRDNRSLRDVLLGGDNVYQTEKLLIAGGVASEVARSYSGEIARNLPVGDSVYAFKEGRHFEAFLKSLSYWLIKNRNLSLEDASECASIAWNLSYLAGEPFYYDSAVFQDEKVGRASPTVTQFNSFPAWMMYHPLERLDTKVVKSGNAWGILGPWAYNRYKRSGGRWSPYDANLLPKLLLENAFSHPKHSVDGNDEKFSDIFYTNGTALIRNPKLSREQLRKPEFSGMGEGIFSAHQFLQVSSAITVFSVINKPSEFDKNWVALSDAYRDLEVDLHYRENILKGLYGLDPKKNKFEPRSGILEYGTGYRAFREAVLKYDPNHFN